MVIYEWDIEILDTDGDINHLFQSSAYDMLREFIGQDHSSKMVLIRTEGSDTDGVTHRAWAYLTGNTLPEFFAVPQANGEYAPINIRVPKRYHAELLKAVIRKTQ